MPSAARFFPAIDYGSHPAFHDFAGLGQADDAVVERLVLEIDGEITRLEAKPYPDEAGLKDAFSGGVGRKLRELSDYLLQIVSEGRVREWLSRAFGTVEKELLEHARIANERHIRPAAVPTSGPAAAVAGDLKRDGAHVCRLDPETHKQLWALCAPYVENLRERAKGQPRARVVQSMERYSRVGQVLARFFRQQGILDGLAGYVGSNVNFTGFSLEYSYPQQTWWRGVYSDVGLPDSKTAYMHYDAGSRDPKAIIALSDVGVENGPTSFVRGSHAQERSTFLHFMITSLDYAFREDEALKNDSANYRPRFGRTEYRREFMMLPKAFQGSSHFGDDILDGSPLSEQLLSNEFQVTKDVGNCIVFDGNYGIHRGALLRSGERVVFQVIFDIDRRPSFKDNAIAQGRGALLRALGRI